MSASAESPLRLPAYLVWNHFCYLSSSIVLWNTAETSQASKLASETAEATAKSALLHKSLETQSWGVLAAEITCVVSVLEGWAVVNQG